MKFNTAAIIAAGVAAFASMPANAFEASVSLTKSGVFIGSSAGAPPPGVYMFDQVYTYQSNFAGPVTNVIGKNTGVQAAVDVQGFLFVPGWTFLGATYDAVIALPFVSESIGTPVNAQMSGMYNTYLVPVELSWKLGDSGFFVKTGLGIWAPTGTVTGAGGTGNVGSPFWTYQPELIVSYLKDGWNLSAAVYEEFHTANTVTGYTSGDVLHADFTATKTIGNWTFGPVAYYMGQVSNDKSSAYYNYLIQNANRYEVWAVGGLVGYNFGPASLSVWATQEVSAKASGATAGGATDLSATLQGATVFATLSYKLWGPDDTSTPQRSMYHK